MHGRVARYGYTGDAHDIAQRAEEGMLPIFRSQPGFKAYSLVETDGEIVSFSAWDSASHADAAASVAADWVAENIGDQLDLKESRVGEILFSTTLGVTTAKAGVTT